MGDVAGPLQCVLAVVAVVVGDAFAAGVVGPADSPAGAVEDGVGVDVAGAREVACLAGFGVASASAVGDGPFA